jgi:hypothetical protein
VRRGAQRLRAAYSALDRDQRFVVGAAVALLLAMFLPWYEKSVVIPGTRSFAHDSISAFGAVSFVEAAIFLVAAGVIVLLLARAEERAFHLPGGDGTVILAAGIWATLLIFYRVFDRPNISGEGGTVGIQWGFFVAFVAAGALAVAGSRIRAAGRPQPPAPRRAPDPAAADTAVVPPSEAPTGVVPASEAPTDVASSSSRPARSRAVTRADAEQLTFDDPAEHDGERPPPGGEIRRARDQR